MAQRWGAWRAAISLLAWVAVMATVLPGCTSTRGAAPGLREFDPKEVARLDTEMWQSYYAKERVRLFFQLAHLIRTQGDCSRCQSYRLAWKAAHAAFVFKRGRSRAEYQQAMPVLQDMFVLLRDVHKLSFDPKRAAQLELEWWIVHRERASRPPGDLEQALAAAAAEVYGLTPVQCLEHSRWRADAMALRDTRAAKGPLEAEDWAAIRALLERSWQSLWDALHR